jgi:hypothetical protein
LLPLSLTLSIFKRDIIIITWQRQLGKHFVLLVAKKKAQLDVKAAYKSFVLII